MRRRMVWRRWMQRVVQVGWQALRQVRLWVGRKMWVRHTRRLERVQAQMCVLVQLLRRVLLRRLRRQT